MIGIIFILFILGLAIGSFLDVVIYRTVHQESFVKGRSKCEHCHAMIHWYDNIPLLSFLVLGGKCRNCHATLSWRYPIIEFITGALFVWWYVMGAVVFRLTTQPFTILQPAFWLLVGIVLIVIFFADLLYGIIPDGAVITLTSLGLLYRIILFLTGVMQPQDFWMLMIASCGALLFFWLLWFCTKGRGMGFGDVKLSFPLGLVLGWPNILVALGLAFIIGAVVGVCLMIWKGKKLKSIVPFGPFLVIGTAIALVWGDPLVSWYVNLLR